MRELSQIRIYAVVILVGILMGYVGGRYLQHPKVEEKIVYKDKIIENTHTVTKTIVGKDGITQIVQVQDTHKQEDSSQITEIKTQPWTYRVGLLGGYDFHQIKPQYGLVLEKNLFTNIGVGIYGMNTGSVGLSVSYQF